MEFEPVIGLEVHAQLNTKTKIFCGCLTSFGDKPNTNVCPVCLGMPGSLPVLNKKVVDFTIRMALALNCQIQTESIFARKNYFYPDLPKGYQISQYEMPIARNGYIDISVKDIRQRIGINRIHIEEDAGKLSHPENRPVSLIDFNRTGAPLIEIVSEPDIRSAEEAAHYLRQLRAIVRYLGIGDGNLEEGSFRCDANVSIRPKGDSRLGTRTELKNLNSFKFVEKALIYEIKRQINTIAEKGKIVQETRLWDSDKNITIPMRSKEEAHDYRYFPDPDLVPLIVEESWIQKVKSDMPELPYEKKQRFISDYSLTEYDAEILTSSREMAQYFEQCLKICSKPKQIANWIMGPLLALINSMGQGIENSPVSAKNMAALIQAIEDKVITNNIAKKVFDEMAKTGAEPAEIIKRKGLVQVADESALEPVIDEILEKNQPQVAQYKEGKTKVIGFFVGQVMKKTGGKANPGVVNELLIKKLS